MRYLVFTVMEFVKWKRDVSSLAILEPVKENEISPKALKELNDILHTNALLNQVIQ